MDLLRSLANHPVKSKLSDYRVFIDHGGANVAVSMHYRNKKLFNDSCFNKPTGWF